MGTTPDRTFKLSEEDSWSEYRRTSIAVARRKGATSADADDIAQTAMLKLWEKRHDIENTAGCLATVTRNEVTSEWRRAERRLRLDGKASTAEDAPRTPENSPVIAKRGIIAELEQYLRRYDETGAVFQQLFGLSILRDQHCLSGATEQSTELRFPQASQSHVNKRRRTELKRIGAHFRRHGIDEHDLLDALRSPEFLFSSSRLARLAAEQSSRVAEQLCQFVRSARIDLLLRAQADRHTFDLRMQQAVWSLNERMFEISRLHPKYMLLGGLCHIRRTLGDREDDRIPLQDIRAQRRILDPLLSRGKQANYAERWLATALYGVLLEQHETSVGHLDDELSSLLAMTERQSLQTIGIGWSWNNASRLQNSAELRQRLLQVVPPDAWPGGLSALPTVVISPYLNGDSKALHRLCQTPLLWELVIRALSSKSHVAVAGGMAFLKNMSPSQCPSTVFAEVQKTLLGLKDTANPFLVEKLLILDNWTT